MRNLFLLLLVSFVSRMVFSQEQTKDISFQVMLNYEYLRFNEQRIHSPGIGMMFSMGNLSPPLSEDRNSLTVAGMYQQYYTKEYREGYEDLYHNIGILGEKNLKST